MKNQQIEYIQNLLANCPAIVKTAIGGNALAISYALTDLGKPATDKWVYKQGEQPDTTRRSFLEQNCLWLAAFVLGGCPADAEYLLAQMKIFVDQVKRIVNDNTKVFPINHRAVELLTGFEAQYNLLKSEILLGAAA